MNMLKLYHERARATEDVSSVAAVTPVGHVRIDDADSSFERTARLNNSEILLTIEQRLSYLPKQQRQDIILLINQYPALFADTPSQTTAIVHDIEIEGSAPIRQHPYRVNPVKREIMKEEVKYLLDQGLAVPSSSPWSLPCILVPKPDGTYRFCTDYRKINSVTKPDSFPMPRMEYCIDRVGGARLVTKLDLLKGYWQVPLTARASEVSAFVTPDDFLNYTVMAFGMRNAPATFQRLMQKVLSGVKSCEAYLDDVVVYSDSWEEHLATLREIFARLSEASLTNLNVNFAKLW